VIPPIPGPAAVPEAAPLDERRRRAFAALEPRDGGEPFFIVEDSVLIGRASPADGVFPQLDLAPRDPLGSVSRRHARLVRDGEEILLEDLGSSNGTFVNNERLKEGIQKALQENDEVRFGALRFVFHRRQKARR
jgi:pSer/pThr/pTyr-binding forkhead associated (FHA) protein